MAKKVHIDTVYGEDYRIIGISCHRYDYWIAGKINENLKLNLSREADLPACFNGTNVILNYPFYHFSPNDGQQSFSLISNHNPDGKLFPGQKSLDYFLLVKGWITSEILINSLNKIKKIPQVLTAHHLDIQKIKNYQEFFSDLELHLVDVAGKKKKRKHQG